MTAQRHTFIVTLIHWALGFMYGCFCWAFVGLFTGVVRVRTSYFVRDQFDPQFDPIREILDRPSFHQFSEICVSGTIHAIFILTCFGIVVKIVDEPPFRHSSNIYAPHWSLILIYVPWRLIRQEATDAARRWIPTTLRMLNYGQFSFREVLMRNYRFRLASRYYSPRCGFHGSF